MPPDSKRRLLYNPSIVPNTFVLFFHKGPGETSWSVRDYSVAGSVELHHAPDFRNAEGRIPPASEVRATAGWDFPAPAHPTTDVDHWHAAVRAANAQYLAGTRPAAPPGDPAPAFPILNLPKLLASPKARKRGDVDRILYSENSEDYVTWNFFQLLESVPASCWWQALLKLAAAAIDPEDTPDVRLWQPVAAPRAYEALSRERMRGSDRPSWRERSLDRTPVEGASEIDIVFEGRTYLAYVEAKLGSDISFNTTYDPGRNQIARNIDCVLENCGERRPFFWMFVRDRQPTWAYVQLMDRYRTVSELHRLLPHRPAARLEEVASGLVVITWEELLALPPAGRVGLEAEVYRELQRRVSIA